MKNEQDYIQKYTECKMSSNERREQEEREGRERKKVSIINESGSETRV